MISRAITAAIAGAGLLSGCALATTAATRSESETACSFRSATTCWTLAGRFPVRQAPAPKPEELRALPPAVLATAADSIAQRR